MILTNFRCQSILLHNKTIWFRINDLAKVKEIEEHHLIKWRKDTPLFCFHLQMNKWCLLIYILRLRKIRTWFNSMTIPISCVFIHPSMSMEMEISWTQISKYTSLNSKILTSNNYPRLIIMFINREFLVSLSVKSTVLKKSFNTTQTMKN